MPTDEFTKPWYTSKTLWGVIVSAVGKAVAVYFGFNITDANLNDAADVAVQLTSADSLNTAIALGVSAIGDAFAFYGRVKADKSIGK